MPQTCIIPLFLLLPLMAKSQSQLPGSRKEEIEMASNAQPAPEAYQRLRFGAIKPEGWLRQQMHDDIRGFVGHLDELTPELFNDPIYGEKRLHKNSPIKDLGNLKSGDAGGDEQYKWWNSETQSNWWDGYIRNVLLLKDLKKEKTKIDRYIKHILATQDSDGYIGIYDRDLRYNFNLENGELWAKTTLYRSLLAYYEATGDMLVWNALVKAVDNVMLNYPILASDPFSVGREFSGGVGHGLTFTDVLDRLYQLTGNRKYWDYALFLYLNYSRHYASEKDAQLHLIFDEKYKLQSHGVHTFEHLRPLAIAAYASGKKTFRDALHIYQDRIRQATTITGGAIGDEWIGGRTADPTQGYEYCSLQELLDSYTVLLQKSGETQYAEEIERIFYNAAQGARHPHKSCIAYLKTDNSYEMLGTKNGVIEPDRKQTRYKYSPAHQDVAVCCNPNAGRISPYFIQQSWLKQGDTTLFAAVLMPNTLSTTIGENKIKIQNTSNYPFENRCVFRISIEKPTYFILQIRKPEWATGIKCNEDYAVENNIIFIKKIFNPGDEVVLDFESEVRILQDAEGGKYFAYGALIYALPINAVEEKGKSYKPGFEDLMYRPVEKERYHYDENHQATYANGAIYVQLKNGTTGQFEKKKLIPFGKTILRQVSF